LVLAATIVAFLFCLPLSAQLNTGRISGQITDQSGGAIAGATVTVIDVARGENRDLVSDSAGQYAAPNLTPGIYTLRAEFMGFKTVDRQNIEVGVGSDNRVDITLQPGEQNQTVTVTEALPIVNTTNAQTGGTLDNQQLSELPMNGRNYRWQADFVPGVMLAVGEGTSNQIINGAPVTGGSWNMMYDGLYSDTFLTRDPGAGGTSDAGDTTIMPLDAIQEVNIVLTPKAEYGWAAGVTYDVGLKSGTNNIHGSAYAYGRDTDFDARNPFAAQRSPVNYEQFGATMGGPIKKDKIFYFAGFEGFRKQTSSTFTVQSPTLADWTGSSGGGASCTEITTGNCTNSIPDAIADINDYIAKNPGTNVNLSALSLNLAGCNATSASITTTTVTSGLIAACAGGNRFGAPGLFGNTSGTTTTVGEDLPGTGESNNGLIKIDYRINDHHQLNGSFYLGRYVQNAVRNRTTPIQVYWEELLAVHSTMGRLVEIWTPNSSWLNEARVGVDHTIKPIADADCGTNGFPAIPSGIGAPGGAEVEGVTSPNWLTQYGYYSGAPGCGIAATSISGFTGALGSGYNKVDWEDPIQGADSLSYTHGAHQFKFGTDIRAENFDGAYVNAGEIGSVAFGSSGFNAFKNGAILATPLEDFLSGEPSTESISPGNELRHVTSDKIGVFVQDDWRIKPRLMLNLGLRWEGETPPRDANVLLGNFAPGTPTGMIQNNQIFKFASNFEPRMGLAWDITGKGTTVLRAGGGSMYMIPKLMDYAADTSATGENYAAEPTGSTLYNANGTFFNVNGNAVTPTGTIADGLITPTAVTTGGSSGLITPTGGLPWLASTSTTSPNNPIFPNLTPQCGDGLAPTGPGIPVGAPTLNPATCSAQGGDPNLHNFTYWFWNLGVQHAFTNNISLDVSYVGSRSYNTINTLNLNQPAFGLAGSSNEQLREPFFSAANNSYDIAYPWFKNITYLANGGGADYTGLQMRLTMRNVHGITLVFNSTTSHSLAQTMVQGVPVLINGDTLGFDVFEHASMTATYAIPAIKAPGQMLQGWEVNATINLMSALPINSTDTKDDLLGAGSTVADPWNLYGPAAPFDKILGGAGNALSNSGGFCYGVANSAFAKAGCITVPTGAGISGSATFVSNLPAACVAGAGIAGTSTAAGVTSVTSPGGYNGYAQLATLGCYEVGGSALVPPAQGMYGTMYPGQLRGKGNGLLNVSVTKDWKIKERLTTQFRAEIFNVLNRTQYAGPGLNLGTPSAFGQATSTPDVLSGNSVTGSGGPREAQLALKFIF